MAGLAPAISDFCEADTDATMPLDSSLRRDCDLAAQRFRYALARHFLLAQKYSPDQPRVPAGNPDGGQWASAAGIAISSPSELLANLNAWAIVGDFSAPAVFNVAAADIPSLADAVMGWLGAGAFQQNSPRGAVQFFSQDKSKLIRFDITPTTSHGLAPHININPGNRHIIMGK